MRKIEVKVGYYEFNVYIDNELAYTIGDVSEDIDKYPFKKKDAMDQAEIMADFLKCEFNDLHNDYYDNKEYTQPYPALTERELSKLKKECFENIYAHYID